MKNLIFSCMIIVALFGVGCSRPANVEAMLQNAETKDQVFSAIIGDQDLMTAFMDKMMADEHAQMMMSGNQQMMQMMMSGGNMMQLMNDKPEMMHQMMIDMMQDGNMMAHMMQMMEQEGMMSEACLKSGMQMMKDKGMSMGMMEGH